MEEPMATTPSHDRPAHAEAAGAGDASPRSRRTQRSDQIEAAHQYVDRSIRTQLLILTVIDLVMLGILAVDIAGGTLGLAAGVAGLLGGVALGVVASRIRRIEWDETASHVVAKLDAIGAIILVGYLGAMLARDWVLGHWAEGPALAALGLSVTAGTLAGRVLGTRRGVHKVLEALGLRPPADLAPAPTLPGAPEAPTPDG